MGLRVADAYRAHVRMCLGLFLLRFNDLLLDFIVLIEQGVTHMTSKLLSSEGVAGWKAVLADYVALVHLEGCSVLTR